MLTKEQIDKIIESHGKWLRREDGGSRADLCGADLRGADLRGADLCDANLCDANLCRADLRGADLCGANLCGANLPKHIVQVGPIGSRKSYTIYNVSDDIVQCGCWNDYKGGSLEEFEKRVADVYGVDSLHYKEYQAAIGLFKAVRDIHVVKNENGAA